MVMMGKGILLEEVYKTLINYKYKGKWSILNKRKKTKRT
jgi:hypothetical protein